jgi:hypothetical protein
VQGVQLDFDLLRGQLQPALDHLSQAIQRVDEEARQLERTLRSKDLALDSFDAALRGIGRILIGCNEVAGFPEFGERIRLTLPNRRRKGSGVEEAGPDDGEDSEPSDAATPETPAPES